ncbi:MAG: alpha/beta-hydrolase family protein [Promicromonosporaceae bacterium]|nr:alpha/beta-hydrolase family protein [Promicromonosporaceae bacterium]
MPVQAVRDFFARKCPAGLTGALLFYCLSLTPSLLPRAWLLQAVVSGVSVTIGYTLGAFLGWLARRTVRWQPTPAVRRAARWSLAGAALVLVPLFGVLGARWQHQTRALVGVDQPSESRYLLVVVVAIAMASAAVLLARSVRSLVGIVARGLHGFAPRRVAGVGAAVIVVAVLAGLVTGLLPRAAMAWADGVFLSQDTATDPGVRPPTSSLRSGGPGSLVPWSALGRQGRTFVSSGPTPHDIAAFTGTPAVEPIRAYVGVTATTSLTDASALAVRELERTGAFQRKVLVVATTTGTGWINPRVMTPLEYMYGGDTAVVALQYSHLPSWISFLVDQDVARQAGRDLFDAVHARWEQLPAGRRPRLVALGESLGSLGSQAAFPTVDDVRTQTSAALWVGTPNDSSLWRELTAAREPGTPPWRPVYQGGRTVRFGSTPSQVAWSDAGPVRPSVLFLQNPSDPIVWWSWDLALHRPDWLVGAHPPGVSPQMHWYPFVTFWQVSADLALSTEVPAGHGHTYGTAQATAAWASLVPPDGWTGARTAELSALLSD